jgi:hypothetical protein
MYTRVVTLAKDPYSAYLNNENKLVEEQLSRLGMYGPKQMRRRNYSNISKTTLEKKEIETPSKAYGLPQNNQS